MTITQHAHIYSFHTLNFIFGQIIFLKFLSKPPLFKWGQSIDMGEVLYSTKWVKYSTLLQATTQNTTTTHNNQHEPLPPFLQRLWPSLSMATYAKDPNLCTAVTYGPIEGSWCWLRDCHSWFPCLGSQKATHQKTERKTGHWP